MARSEQEIEEQQERIRRRMLEAEAALLLLARRRIEETTGPGDIRAVAQRLRDVLTFVYAAGRRQARRISAAETEAELVLLAEPYGIPPADIGRGVYRSSVGKESVDAYRGRRAATGYAEHWLDDAERIGADAAVESQGWRVQMHAATESADAFAAEREAVIDDFAYQLYRVWDATMDRRTCPTCAGAHGSIVRIDEPFPEGRPGGVHPNCRCTEQILTADEADLDYYAGVFAA